MTKKMPSEILPRRASCLNRVVEGRLKKFRRPFCSRLIRNDACGANTVVF